jgi:LuxR family maltose regulon positive regulatory protein
LAEQAGRTHLYLRSLDLYAHLLADTGDLMAASVIVQKARVCFQSTSEDDSLLPIPEFTASYIAYQRDELEEARRSCLHAIQAARQHEAWPWEMKAHVFLSDVYRARHNTEGALRELNEADILMRDRVSQTRARGHRLLDAISARRAWIAIAQGERGAAAGWRAHASSIDAERASLTSWIDRPVLTVTVRAFLLDGHTDQVMAFLTPLLARAEAAGAGEAYLGLLVLWALVQVAAGKHDRALQELAAALRLSAPQQNRRFFLDEGKQMPALLHAALQHQALDLPTRRFTRDLLTRFSSSAAPARRVEPTHPDLVEALSDREREILRLVASGLSNQEIADQLIVELSTVKWYITSIHGKLGVGRRTQAVARGRELGLLP